MFKQAKAFSSFSVDDIDKAKDFYGNVLGLDISDTMGGINLHIEESSDIFVYPKQDHLPATFTVLNFVVEDLEAVVDDFISQGVVFEQYDEEDMKTDEKGIATQGEGLKMAWFKDPAGNFLSVIENI